MKSLLILLILLSIAVATPVSAEEIKLTTIIPDQTILRTKRGAIGDNYSNPATIPDGSIPTSGLLVESKVGIGTGTTSLDTALDVNGAVSVRGMTSDPPLSPIGQGRIYFNSVSSKFLASESGGLYGPLGGGGGGGPVFINSLPISLSVRTGAFTTVDVSSVVPSGATAVILQAEVNSSWTSVAFPAFSVNIRIRRDAASPFYSLFRFLDSGRAGGVTPVERHVEMNTQGKFPITSARTFQYSFGANANIKPADPEYIKVIGYYQ